MGGPVTSAVEGILFAKVEDRATRKISRRSIFGLLCYCVAFQRRYEAPWLFLYETMWSPISPRAKGISILKNFGRRPKEGQTLTWRWSAPLGPDRLRLVI